MMKKTELISRIAKQTKGTPTSCTQDQVRDVLEYFVATVQDELRDGRKIGLMGLGNFVMVKRKPKSMKLPGAFFTYHTRGRMAVKFLPSVEMSKIGKGVE